MISGVHALIYSQDAARARAFFQDVLGFDAIDSGGGWLIFALPPAELGIHPTDGMPRHELYLMCDDIDATVAALRAKGAEFAGDIVEAGFGRLATLVIPGGGDIGVYQPRHATAIDIGTAASGGG